MTFIELQALPWLRVSLYPQETLLRAQGFLPELRIAFYDHFSRVDVTMSGNGVSIVPTIVKYVANGIQQLQYNPHALSFARVKTRSRDRLDRTI